MYSIIVCSIRPKEAEALKTNIEKTIGQDVPFEFIAYDNRGTGKGICQVYNECAARAKYDFLCFIHEDVEFITEDWGRKIGEKLAEDSCGVIGFVGSAMKAKAPTGWNSTRKYGVRSNYIQGGKTTELIYKDNPYDQRFSQVVTLDGLCLITKKSVWSKIRFDDNVLKGFHCYDVDFTIAAADAGFKNWVANCVMVKHNSLGSYDRNWLKENEKMHVKWNGRLPLYVKRKHYLKREYYEFRSKIEWMCTLGEKGIYDNAKTKYVLGYLMTHPFNKRTYRFIGRWLKNRNQVQRNH